MSRNNQKPSTEMNDVLIHRQFALRLWDTWEAPSLIVLLDGRERRLLRETFDIHWADLDVHIRMVDECVGTGVSRDQRVRRDKNVKVVYELNKVPEGIQVLLYIVAMTVGVQQPLVDENGYARKITFERLFPENRLKDLFMKANAFVTGMSAYKLALWAKEDGDEKTFTEMGRSLDHFHDVLSGADTGGLTAKVEEVARKNDRAGQKDNGQKKGKIKAEKIAVATKVETADDRADDLARKLTMAATGIDPGAGHENDAETAPVIAAPPPAPKPKKEKAPRAPKLGLADLGSLKDKLPVGPTDGSNGQSS